MGKLEDVAPAFVAMAHQIVWCSAATVDRHGRPRTRILHPIWEWDGESLVGWIATVATPLKRAHLEHSPHLSINYWTPSQDTCVAECRAAWALDLETRRAVWDLFASGPEPVGYNPNIIEGWEDPSSEGFATLRLDPWRLRVFPGGVLLGQGGDILTWHE